jgi:hypothetical protein
MIEFAIPGDEAGADAGAEVIVYSDDQAIMDIVPIEVHGLLAIHLGHSIYGERMKWYVVSHIPSGRMVASAIKRKMARELVGRLEKLDWTGTTPEVVERLRGTVPAIIREVCGGGDHAR